MKSFEFGMWWCQRQRNENQARKFRGGKSTRKNPPKIKKFIWTSFSEQFPLPSWLVSQGGRQKFAQTFRKSSRERGVFWVFRDFGWVFGPLKIRNEKSAQRESFRPDVPADIRPKTSVRPSKSWKKASWHKHAPRTSTKKLRSEKLRADFSFPRKRRVNINFLVRLPLGETHFAPGTGPGFRLILHSGSPICPRDKPSLSLGQSRGRRAA